MRTIGSVVSRVKDNIKAVKQDAFLTDRFVFSMISKHASLFMRRQDSANKLTKFSTVWQALPYIELVEVDKIESQCAGIKAECTIKRTKDKLPDLVEGYWGGLIRSVFSLDSSEEVSPTSASNYINMTNQKNFRFNKTKYYWYLNGYLYFPNVDWDAVRIEGLFKDDILGVDCRTNSCIIKQDQPYYIPEFLDSEIEALVFKDLGINLSVPADNVSDKQNISR